MNDAERIQMLRAALEEAVKELSRLHNAGQVVTREAIEFAQRAIKETGQC